MKHHEDTIAHVVAAAVDHPEWRALIFTGSVAKKSERTDSDVDASIVVDEDYFEIAFDEGRVAFVDHELSTYEGGYLDFKLTTIEQLRLAAQRGDEPTRATYLGARVEWVHSPGLKPELEAILRQVIELPENEWERRQASGIAFFRLQVHYFAPHALAVGDAFLLHHAAVHAVSGAARAILALNHTLFVSNKYLSSAVPALPNVPAEWTVLTTALLETPTQATFDAFATAVEGVHDWGMDANQTDGRYIADNELAWLTGVPPAEYR